MADKKPKRPKNLSFNQGILNLADEIMQKEHRDDFSDFVAELIRDKHKEVFGGVPQKDTPVSSALSLPISSSSARQLVEVVEKIVDEKLKKSGGQDAKPSPSQ